MPAKAGNSISTPRHPSTPLHPSAGWDQGLSQITASARWLKQQGLDILERCKNITART
ncbi:hypothetical protein N9R01_00150 [Porticoccaceae bacterium]|nr:hypothetical protein [Porticoccaceae bacterium]